MNGIKLLASIINLSDGDHIDVTKAHGPFTHPVPLQKQIEITECPQNNMSCTSL